MGRIAVGLGRGMARGLGLVAVEAKDRLAGPAHPEGVARDVLDVGRIVFHVLGLKLELGLEVLRVDDLPLQLGLFRLEGAVCWMTGKKKSIRPERRMTTMIACVTWTIVAQILPPL